MDLEKALALLKHRYGGNMVVVKATPERAEFSVPSRHKAAQAAVLELANAGFSVLLDQTKHVDTPYGLNEWLIVLTDPHAKPNVTIAVTSLEDELKVMDGYGWDTAILDQLRNAITLLEKYGQVDRH